MRKKKSFKKGFTLAEVLVVVIIFAIASGLFYSLFLFYHLAYESGFVRFRFQDRADVIWPLLEYDVTEASSFTLTDSRNLTLNYPNDPGVFRDLGRPAVFYSIAGGRLTRQVDGDGGAVVLASGIDSNTSEFVDGGGQFSLICRLTFSHSLFGLRTVEYNTAEEIKLRNR